MQIRAFPMVHYTHTIAQRHKHLFRGTFRGQEAFDFCPSGLGLFGFPRAWEEFSQIPSLRPFLSWHLEHVVKKGAKA